MLEQLLSRSDQSVLLRKVKLPFRLTTVSLVESEELESKGWELHRLNKTSVVMRAEKPIHKKLEDRLWVLMYKLGFPRLSGEGGATLGAVSGEPLNQLDLVALDDDVCICCECKTAETPRKYERLQHDLGKFTLLKQKVQNEINSTFRGKAKPSLGLVLVLANLQPSPTDLRRCEEADICVLTEHDLEYYEALERQIGIAARGQLLADLFQGRKVRALETAIPAVQIKQGAQKSYLFAITPSYLLKIAFVSHRAKGKASDVDTYQRMIQKSRVKKIRQFIEDGGTFPTNIVVNFSEPKCLHFESRKAEGVDEEGGSYGVLTIRPTYKSAWIIDGQHRLFAYAGAKIPDTTYIYVLAYHGLARSMQAQLFIEINNEQKSVKRSLLQELFAELHWDSDSVDDRISAIISKSMAVLNYDADSPFRNRIKMTDDLRSDIRCITVPAIFSQLESSSLFIQHKQKNQPIQYGVFYSHDQTTCMGRLVEILKYWFRVISDANKDWWNIGSGEGGGLAMNDGISACTMLLKSVVDHLESEGLNLVTLSVAEVKDVLRPYSEAAADYFNAMTGDERARYRSLRGVQGLTARLREMQMAVHARIEQYNPSGLREYIDSVRADYRRKAYECVVVIESTLQTEVLRLLREHFGAADRKWWYQGIPDPIRKKAAERLEEAKDPEANAEQFLDLIDYRGIALANWQVMERVMGRGKKGNKEERTKWLVEVNEIRKTVSHATRGLPVSLEKLTFLEEMLAMLRERLSPR